MNTKNRILGKKQSISNDDWINALPFIKNTITEDEICKLEAETVSEIISKTGGKKAAYAWSGGKDSAVLSRLCGKAGIHECMLAVCNLEYPAFMTWVNENKPPNLEIINTGQDMDWLVRNPDMLFPDVNKNDPALKRRAASLANKWFAIVQHRAQTQYFKDRKLDILLLGRRRSEGNFIGRGGNLYTTGNGVTKHSPIAYWTHEQVLAYIAYNGLKLPPIYGWPNGYKCGTHPWPARTGTGSVDNAWREVYAIDPSIVHEASRHFTSAKLFLEDSL